MRFGQHLNTGRIPEWEFAYVDYDRLKKALKPIDKADSAEAKQHERHNWKILLQEEIDKANKHVGWILQQLEDYLDKMELHYSQCAATDQEHLGQAKVTQQDLIVRLAETMATAEKITQYASMNYVCFYKILKKYDKKTNPEEGQKMSPQLAAIAEEPFHDGQRIVAIRHRMNQLNLELGGKGLERYKTEEAAKAAESRECVSFWLGFMTMALFNSGVLLIIPATSQSYTLAKLMASFPVFRFFLMLCALLWLCGWVITYFERYKVNYIMLLGINPKCPISSMMFFRLASITTGVWMLSFWLFLCDFKFNVLSYMRGPLTVTIYPTMMVISMVVALFCPKITGISLTYKYDLLYCLGEVVGSVIGLPVTFASNLLGDVLTSTTRPLQDLIYTGCYIGNTVPQVYHHIVTHAHGEESGSFVRDRADYCHAVQSMGTASVILTFPFIFRFLQCLRRYYDSPATKAHLVNAGKYASSILVTAMGFFMPNSVPWVVCYIFATLYACSWDFKMDWGLQWIDGRLTRETHLYPHLYYSVFAILNFLGRCTWALTTLTATGHQSTLTADAFFLFLATFEVYRRAQWAIIRIEHEHVANPSKYRSMVWVPPLASEEARKEKKVLAVDDAEETLRRHESNKNLEEPLLHGTGDGMTTGLVRRRTGDASDEEQSRIRRLSKDVAPRIQNYNGVLGSSDVEYERMDHRTTPPMKPSSDVETPERVRSASATSLLTLPVSADPMGDMIPRRQAISNHGPSSRAVSKNEASP